MFTVMLLLIASVCGAEEVVLVVNSGNPVTSVSRKNAEQIFLGKKTLWSTGAPVHVAVNNENGVYQAFCWDILRKTPGQYLLYRKKMLFNGSGIPPLTMENDDEMKSFIARSPQAIGFISRKSLDSRVKELIIQD